MFAAWVLANHHLIPDIVRVCNAFGVFAPIVLDDEPLLSFLNVLPVGLERYVEDGVAVEHQLRWRGSGRSVHRWPHSLPNGG